jgi:hypothetical protein
VTRVVARAAFVCGAVLAAGVIGSAALVALTPKPVPISEPTSIAVAKLSALKERQPQYVLASGLNRLKAEARRLRSIAGPFSPMSAAVTLEGDLGVYLVRYDGTVRAFISADPRNGCRLNVDYPGTRLADGGLAFHDVCHGSLYDINGQHIGGPSPWNLDELLVSVHNDLVYVDRKVVIAGRQILR